MKKYEYKGIPVNVPEGWHEIKLSLYDKIWSLKPQTARERANVIATVCGVELEVFLAWPTDIFNLVLKDLNFLFSTDKADPVPYIEIGPDKYHIAIETRLSFGEYIDVDAIQKEEKYANAILSNILAVVCRPAGEAYDPNNNEVRAQIFAELPVAQVRGVLAFFLRCYELSTQRMQMLNDLRETANLLLKSSAPLLKRGVGIKWWRIYQIIKFYILTRLLRARLSKFLRLSYMNGTAA